MLKQKLLKQKLLEQSCQHVNLGVDRVSHVRYGTHSVRAVAVDTVTSVASVHLAIIVIGVTVSSNIAVTVCTICTVLVAAVMVVDWVDLRISNKCQIDAMAGHKWDVGDNHVTLKRLKSICSTWKRKKMININMMKIRREINFIYDFFYDFIFRISNYDLEFRNSILSIFFNIFVDVNFDKVKVKVFVMSNKCECNGFLNTNTFENDTSHAYKGFRLHAIPELAKPEHLLVLDENFLYKGLTRCQTRSPLLMTTTKKFFL